ncbi:protein DpdG [Alteromonas sp. RKMC-009]|uniref:protein DpdG n=1 Tax=Alteromonas sp. RKMC-009 TaxID=2267264 RepID=UPI0010C3AD00|nr:protein DpdG [Alteromonas sp. RKMC-009]AYA62600.2 hypothetical protein DS731_00465 [Alteromonas sp. RKMC-009]
MSVINNAHSGSHIASLIFIDRLVNRRIKNGKAEYIPMEEILEKYRPDYLFKDDKKDENGEFKFQDNPYKKLKESLSFWSNLGLWQKKDDNICAKDMNASELNFPSRLCECIFSEKVDVIDGNGIEPLIRSMVLFLSLGRYTLVGNEHFRSTDIGNIASKYFPSFSENQTRLSINNSETGVLSDYGILLGLFEKVDKNLFTVDPTRLFSPFIKKVLSSDIAKNGLSIDDFLIELRREIPVVDGGEYRVIVENLISSKNSDWIKPQSHQLSASLSIALHRLTVGRVIKLENKSDSELTMHMLLPGNTTRPISHISLGGM